MTGRAVKPRPEIHKDFRIKNFDIHFNYCRVIGELSNPDYLDYSFYVYERSEEEEGAELRPLGSNPECFPGSSSLSYSIQFWIDTNEKTIQITKGAYHDEPLHNELIDLLIKHLKLEKYTIN